MRVNVADTGFAEALIQGDRGRLVAFPKADRHCHSLLGASLQSITARAGKPIAAPPPRMAGLREMKDYAHAALSVFEDLTRHPIQALARNGVRVTINSDDKTIFGKTVTDEYLGLFRAGTLTAEELEGIRVESLRG